MMPHTFFNIDCMDKDKGMPSYPDKHFELAIVDPPYGIGADNMTMGSGRHSFKKGKEWDNKPPTKEYFDELFRISNNQIIWGGNYFNLPKTPHWIVWDKCNPNLSFAEGELAWVANGNNLRIFKHYSALPDGGSKIHPTQKPIALYKWLLTKYAKPGDKILDTHVGSASSIIACIDLGFDVWGYELDEDYYKAATKRIADFESQLKIF